MCRDVTSLTLNSTALTTVHFCLGPGGRISSCLQVQSLSGNCSVNWGSLRPSPSSCLSGGYLGSGEPPALFCCRGGALGSSAVLFLLASREVHFPTRAPALGLIWCSLSQPGGALGDPQALGSFSHVLAAPPPVELFSSPPAQLPSSAGYPATQAPALWAQTPSGVCCLGGLCPEGQAVFNVPGIPVTLSVLSHSSSWPGR